MKEMLEKLLKEMEEQEKAKEDHKEDFKKRKEQLKQVIDEEESAILVSTSKCAGFAGHRVDLMTMFCNLAHRLIETGALQKEVLLMEIEIAALDDDDEDFAKKALEIADKYLGNK